jgi:hypothetical protein
MAQLCVVMEDLYLELKGLKEDEIKPLDRNGDNYRSAYFFRNSTKTIFEMRKAVQCLKGQEAFMKQLANQKGFHEALKDFDKAMFQSRDLLKRLRHKTSGHLDEGVLKNALKKISCDTQQLFQAGSNPKTLQYKFCLEFLGAIFLREVDKDFEEEWGRILKTTADVSFKANRAVDMIFMAYVEQRGFQY